MIFDTCVPRADVLAGTVKANFTADFARVVRSGASEEYAVYTSLNFQTAPRVFWH